MVDVNYIKRYLWGHYSASEYKLFNTWVFDFESDFFLISNSGYVVECEIKMSRSDFKADFKKTHRWGSKLKNKHEWLQDKNETYKPNRFYFVCPKGLIKKEEIPNYAGLIEIESGCSYVTKNAPLLHKTKLLQDIKFVRVLLNKFYYRSIDLRIALDIKEYDITYGQQRIEYVV